MHLRGDAYPRKHQPTRFWLKDKSLTDLDNLPEPDYIVEEISENLEAGLNRFPAVFARLDKGA
jgi:type I restriction enzyme M protein